MRVFFVIKNNIVIDHSSVTDEVEQHKSIESSKKKLGQPQLVSGFPDIVGITANFTKQHGYPANYRWYNEITYSSGVKIKGVCNGLFEKVTGLF